MKWLLLIISLPTENATARMRAWRALKASGAVVLRDGVYLLPADDDRQLHLRGIGDDIVAAGGAAWLLEAMNETYPFSALFDRTEEYLKLAEEIAAAERVTGEGDQARHIRKLRKGFAGIAAIDFFPSEARHQIEARLSALEARMNPDEPVGRPGVIQRRDPARYRKRRWATRRRPWVDRLASAWLIRRFIDPGAVFLWLASPADCPADAVGFDFDGAEFSHVETPHGTLATFENLLAAFGLEPDPALVRIGAIVHYLDVGGLPAAEASGLECLLRGMLARTADDDALFADASRVFDDFHLAFGQETP